MTLRPEIYLHWNMLRECNFSCNYCIVEATGGAPRKVDVSRIVQRLNRFNKTMLISFSGGEPFLIPNFTELCAALSESHLIRIDTNLSLDDACEKFLHVVNPDRVLEICFSTHVLEREKRGIGLDRLRSLVNRFQDKGFTMIGKFVAYPPLIERMENDIKFFESHGIRVLPSFFWGTYKGKSYPFDGGQLSYTHDDYERILKLNPRAETQIQKVRGSYCQAGCTAFTINWHDEVFMCDLIPKKLGNFFDEWQPFKKVIRCPKDYCNCPLNRAPSITSYPSNYPTEDILRKTLKERGAYSSLKSSLLTGRLPCILSRHGKSPITGK